jgi:hypothetical protein
MPIAFDVKTIVSGAASVTLSMPADAYTVEAFIDLNGNNGVLKGAETGEPYATDDIVLSADTAIVYKGTGLTINKRITVTLTGATEFDGKTFFFALFPPSSQTMPFAADFRIITLGQASVTLAAPPGAYSFGVFIDLNMNLATVKQPEAGEPSKNENINISADTSLVYAIADLTPVP